MKITIKNFQSLSTTSIEAEGFTVITGPSNLGKTALVRAISGTFWGIPGDFYVRQGTVGCAVRIVDPTFDITWKKVKKPQPGLQTMLRINGTDHTKLGRDHASLTEGLGFKEIQTTGRGLRPQVAYQHDPIFLITETEITVAEVFKQLGRTDIITHAQNKAGKDRRDAESTIKIRVKDIDNLKQEMLELTGVQDLARTRDETREALAQAETRQAALVGLLTSLRRLSEVQPRPVLTPLPEIKGSQDVHHLNLLRRLRSLRPQPITIVLPEIPPIQAGLSQLKRLIELTSASEEDRTKVAELAMQAAQVDIDIGKLEVELGFCPQCGRKL